jgi:ribosome-binding protein aMBF1 (putative translation factor)
MPKYWVCDLCGHPVTGTPLKVKYRDIGWDCCMVTYRKRYHRECWKLITDSAAKLMDKQLRALDRELIG